MATYSKVTQKPIPLDNVRKKISMNLKKKKCLFNKILFALIKLKILRYLSRWISYKRNK